MNDRKNVNTPQVKAKDFPHSGFDLSYKSRADFILGRLHPVGYQYIMPGDKFSGKCDVKHTFNTLVVPEISDVNVSIHHFYVPFRSIDDTFIDGMVPTELNGMSSTWRVPTFNIHALILLVANQISNLSEVNQWIKGDLDTLAVRSTLKALYLDLSDQYENLFYQSFFADAADYIDATIPDGSLSRTDTNLFSFLNGLITPLFGKNSLLDVLGYQYVRSYDIQKVVEWFFDEPVESLSDLIDNFSDLPQNEYAIRAYYAIWYEHFRDKMIEKRTTDLPDWRKFGSTSIFQTIEDVVCFLPVRVRSWAEDMFTTSKPDDISRHVFAPIIHNDAFSVKVSKDAYNYEDAEYATLGQGAQGLHNLQYYDLSYIDPNTGNKVDLSCPVPKAVNDVLNNLDSTLQSVSSLALDLRDLRMSQMAERYLKRNFYFGDEYQDRMIAHYGSKVSDNSIRRPHLIQADGSQINPKQELAPVSTPQMKAGERTATVMDNTAGGNFTFFAEEFGIFISIMSIQPVAQYAGLCPQVLLSQMTDFPLPEFAANNDETGRILEIAISSLDYPQQFYARQFGHYPYAHAWRSRVDEVHGSFLDDRSNYTFRRFFGADIEENLPKLNYQFLHCLPNLGMFENTIRLNGQGYYTADNHFYVERVLPTPVEEI